MPPFHKTLLGTDHWNRANFSLLPAWAWTCGHCSLSLHPGSSAQIFPLHALTLGLNGYILFFFFFPIMQHLMFGLNMSYLVHVLSCDCPRIGDCLLAVSSLQQVGTSDFSSCFYTCGQGNTFEAQRAFRRGRANPCVWDKRTGRPSSGTKRHFAVRLLAACHACCEDLVK